MKYMKGVNINFDDRAYLQSHFEEEAENNLGIVGAINHEAKQ